MTNFCKTVSDIFSKCCCVFTSNTYRSNIDTSNLLTDVDTDAKEDEITKDYYLIELTNVDNSNVINNYV